MTIHPTGLLASLALLATACGSSVTSVRSTADASVDAPAVDVPTTSSSCRSAVGQRFTVISDPPDRQRFRLVDAIPTPDGALVAWRERNPNGRDDQVRVRRIREDATPHPWSAAGRGSRTEVVSLPPSAALQFSMVWDAPHDGVTMLAGGPTDRGACVFSRFLGDNSQMWQVVELGSLMGFSLAGCGSLARTPDGYSFLTGEVRALWGDQLVFVTEAGRFAGAPARLPMTSQPTVAPMTRSVVSGGFMAAWAESVRGSSGPLQELHLRRFDSRGTPRSNDEGQGTADTVSDAQVLETPAGLLSVWHSGSSLPGGPSAILAKPVMADARPGGFLVPFTGRPWIRGIHATARGDEVLVAAPTSEAAIYLLRLSGRGAALAEPLELWRSASPVAVGPVRVVATARGALVVFEVETAEQGGRIVAVPVDCAP